MGNLILISENGNKKLYIDSISYIRIIHQINLGYNTHNVYLDINSFLNDNYNTVMLESKFTEDKKVFENVYIKKVGISQSLC